MKRIIILLLIIILSQDIALAYQIVATDKVGYVFKAGDFRKDSHRYKVIYEVDEANMTISVVDEIDLSSGEHWKGDTTYQIIPQATVVEFKNNLKGSRVNPKRASIEGISFCNGEYVYSKIQEDYVNLFYGTYVVAK